MSNNTSDNKDKVTCEIIIVITMIKATCQIMLEMKMIIVTCQIMLDMKMISYMSDNA